MDGANMNAQVGLTNPATIGADVCLKLTQNAILSWRWWTRCWANCVNEKLVPFYQVIH
jgi:glycine dehydrogenase